MVVEMSLRPVLGGYIPANTRGDDIIATITNRVHCYTMADYVEKVVVLWRGTNAFGYYAAALGLLRNMTIPSHMNHTI